MRLDADLMRGILLWVEANLPENAGTLAFPPIEGYPEQDIAYNCLLAAEAGLIEAYDVGQEAGHAFEHRYPRRLTYFGHQYVDSVRDDKVWATAKQGAKKIGSFSLETLGALAKGVIAVQIKKHSGLDIDLET